MDLMITPLRCKYGRYMRGRLIILTGEFSQVLRSKHYRKLSKVTTNCEKSAEVIVLEIFFRKDRTTARFAMEGGKTTK